MRYFAPFVATGAVVAAQTIEFFYTETLDLCKIDSASIPANEQTTHGGVCAYRRDVARVYGCPSPDPTCWTFAEQCNESNIGQTVCNRAGSVWCCNAVAGESCTTTSGQINVCISNFTSPNSGVDTAQANKIYQSAIGLSTVTATSQSVDPTPFSTRNLVSTASTASVSQSTVVSLTSSSNGKSSQTPSTSSGTGAAQNTGANSANLPVTSSNSGLSDGAIAGIVIGAIAALLIGGLAVFFIMRKKRNSAESHEPSKDVSEASAGSSAYASSNEKKHGGYYAAENTPSEMGSENQMRAEMPTNVPRPITTERHELA